MLAGWSIGLVISTIFRTGRLLAASMPVSSSARPALPPQPPAARRGALELAALAVYLVDTGVRHRLDQVEPLHCTLQRIRAIGRGAGVIPNRLEHLVRPPDLSLRGHPPINPTERAAVGHGGCS